MIPTLETERLTLVAPDLNCLDTYLQFYTDGDASALYGGPINEEQVWSRLKADIGSWYLSGFGVWAVQLKANQQVIGTCGFWCGKHWPTELTWWVLPEHRGLGIATEASLAAIDHAYNHFNWELVETYMNDDNQAARALVEKLGGIKVDRREFSDGLSRDIYRIPHPIKSPV